MKRTVLFGILGVILTMAAVAQDRQEGDGTWYETPGSLVMRASHATLPFGTRIRVTNTLNNKQTIVSVFGRISANEGDPIVSVSSEAARLLGMSDTPAETGKTPVVIEQITAGRETTTPEPDPVPEPVVAAAPEPEPPAPEPEPAPTPAPAPTAAAASPGNFTVQTIININGSTVDVATRTIEEPAPTPAPTPTPAPSVQPRMPPATVMPRMPDPANGHIYRVQAGSFLSPLNAQNCFERLKAAGFNPAYERYEEYYRVVLSGVRASEMQTIAQQLGNLGIREVWIRQEY